MSSIVFSLLASFIANVVFAFLVLITPFKVLYKIFRKDSGDSKNVHLKLILVIIVVLIGGLILGDVFIKPRKASGKLLASKEASVTVTKVIIVQATPKPKLVAQILLATDTPTSIPSPTPSSTISHTPSVTPQNTATTIPTLPPTSTPTPTPNTPPPHTPTPTPPCFGSYEDFYFLSPASGMESKPKQITLRLHLSNELVSEREEYEIRYVKDRSGRTLNPDQWPIAIEKTPIDSRNEILTYWTPKESGTYRLLPLFESSSGQHVPTTSECAIKVIIR